jgi:hypothetical protein
MAILVVQSTAGTSALNGTAPDPTNVPGNNWVADANTARLAGGGVGIPNVAFDTKGASYNLGTARQKISATNIVVQDTTALLRALINKDAAASAPFSSGTGYSLIVQASNQIGIYSWSGSGSPTLLASSASSITSSAPFTITSLVFEHLISGTLNATIVISGTSYTATYSPGAPLTGTWLGFLNTTGATGGMNFASIQFEDNTTAATIYEFASLNRGIGRGIARGIA